MLFHLKPIIQIIYNITLVCFIYVNRHYMHKMIKSHCIFNNFLYLQQYICILFLITRKGGFICIPITHT